MTLTRLLVLALAPQSVVGTAATLTGADCIPVGQFQPTSLEADVVETQRLSGLYGKSAVDLMAAPRTVFPGIPFDFAGSGTVGTAPIIGRFLRAAGFAEVVTPSTSVVYTLANVGSPVRWTASCGIDGFNRLAFDALVTELTITAEVGSTVRGECSITGTYTEPTETANLTPTTTLKRPVVFDSAGVLPGTVSIHDWTGACLSNFSLTIGNESPVKAYANCQQQILHTNRAVTGSVAFRRSALASFNSTRKVRNSEVGSIVLPFNNGAGNTTTITLPKVQFTSIGDQDDDGMLVQEMNFQLIIESSADFPTIAFT